MQIYLRKWSKKGDENAANLAEKCSGMHFVLAYVKKKQ